MMSDLLLSSVLLAQAIPEARLTTAGWIFMAVACGLVAFLTAFCFYRLLFTPQKPS
jgi:hypothetical protein